MYSRSDFVTFLKEVYVRKNQEMNSQSFQLVQILCCSVFLLIETTMNLYFKSNFKVFQPSDSPVMKVTSSLAVLLHFRLVAIVLAV